MVWTCLSPKNCLRPPLAKQAFAILRALHGGRVVNVMQSDFLLLALPLHMKLDIPIPFPAAVQPRWPDCGPA